MERVEIRVSERHCDEIEIQLSLSLDVAHNSVLSGERELQIKTKQENEYKLFKWLLTMNTLFILRLGCATARYANDAFSFSFVLVCKGICHLYLL